MLQRAHTLQVNILIDVNVVDTRNPWKVVLAHRPAPIMVSAQPRTLNPIRTLLLQPTTTPLPDRGIPYVRTYGCMTRRTVPTVPLRVLRPLRRSVIAMRAVL